MMQPSLIVRVVPHRTIKTCLLLRDAACGGELVQDLTLRVRITRVGCAPKPQPKRVWTGCCYEECEPDPCPEPVLEYPAFEIDTEGRLCFYWDKLLYSQPPGRYKAVILNSSNREVYRFSIQLEGMQITAAQAASVEAEPDCTSSGV